MTHHRVCWFLPAPFWNPHNLAPASLLGNRSESSLLTSLLLKVMSILCLHCHWRLSNVRFCSWSDVFVYLVSSWFADRPVSLVMFLPLLLHLGFIFLCCQLFPYQVICRFLWDLFYKGRHPLSAWRCTSTVFVPQPFSLSFPVSNQILFTCQIILEIANVHHMPLICQALC